MSFKKLKNLRSWFALKTSRIARWPVRLVIGSGGIAELGWIASDIDLLNILSESDWQSYFSENSIQTILAEHVWEHFSPEQAAKAAELCFRYLHPGGYLRVAVPDGLHPDQAYIDAVKPGGHGPGADDHKVLYSHQTLQALFEKAGFTTRLLEYFDKSGTFHETDWNPEHGLIRRSKRFDDRNKDGNLHYTSIIIDAIKK